MQAQEIITIRQKFFELISDLVLFLDSSLSVTWCNSAFCHFKDKHNITDVTDFIPQSLLNKAIDNTDDSYEFEFQSLHFQVTCYQLQNTDTFVVICDNTDDRQQLYELIYTDPVSKVGNLALSIKTINDFFVELADNPQAQMLIMGIDFDGFERIDFVYGDNFSDSIVIEFARQLQAFQEGNIVCRTSGDDVLLMHRFEGDELDIEHFKQQVIDIFSNPFVTEDNNRIAINTNIGGAILPKDGKNRDQAINSVQLAHQEAKKYYDTVSLVFYQPSFGHANDHLLNISNKLEEAIENNYLELYYQPKVNVLNKKIYGCEALLRWHDPDLGFISPADFIPIAENTGKIVQIGLWVFEQVCQQINTWQSKGFALKVSLNVSIRQLQDTNFISSFKQVLEETKVDTSLIELEITESILSEDLEVITQLFQQIKALGLSISLDDFGTKYSSLSYLTNLPVDILKIDRSFIKDSCTNIKDAAIAKTIVILAKELQLKVVAEGVEDQEQVSLLEDIQCDYIQGFYYYRPMCVGDIDKLLHTLKSKEWQW